ncbi:hypothetical protein B9Z55_009551 [Caenorhabditis nigoni]|uniref:Dolichyl-diphosphooligosaccharide--protein glycosyltransferase subunit 4 n=1 Tax=Caenorhabditis nigoni TaxID=1611254 RepID=A0A2G5USK4_9PELO|nr:hypothetical protein B9Z55_009551 [Caenorhabditis nigoni]
MGKRETQRIASLALQLRPVFSFCRRFAKFHPFFSAMISDVQLGICANILGIAMLMLVVLFHYLSANQKNK